MCKIESKQYGQQSKKNEVENKKPGIIELIDEPIRYNHQRAIKDKLAPKK